MQQNVWGENVMVVVWCVCVSEIVHFQTFLPLRISSLLMTNFVPVVKRYVYTPTTRLFQCVDLCIIDYVLDSLKLLMKVLGVYVQLSPPIATSAELFVHPLLVRAD